MFEADTAAAEAETAATSATTPDFAQRILAALTNTETTTLKHGESFDADRHVVLGEVPAHLRGLWLLRLDLNEEARVAEEQLEILRRRQTIVKTIFSESLDVHVPVKAFTGNVAMGDNWQVLGEKEDGEVFDLLAGLAEFLAPGMRRR